MLATAGSVLFTGDGSGNFVAFDATNGKILWHTRIGNISNAPQTYLVDGKQHVLVGGQGHAVRVSRFTDQETSASLQNTGDTGRHGAHGA